MVKMKKLNAYRAARKIMKKKIWRDSQIKNITTDLNNLEEIIRDNWETIGYLDRGVLYSAEEYINKYLSNDKRALALKDWIQELNDLADERAAFASCLR